jgi:hypothetical protein
MPDVDGWLSMQVAADASGVAYRTLWKMVMRGAAGREG